MNVEKFLDQDELPWFISTLTCCVALKKLDGFSKSRPFKIIVIIGIIIPLSYLPDGVVKVNKIMAV